MANEASGGGGGSRARTGVRTWPVERARRAFGAAARTVTIAALIVLFFAPEAVVHPSFQMSFAATLALIAGYERGIPWARAGADTSLGARAALWGVCEILSLIVASLLAGLATTPYAAFHFHRMAPYGVLANLLAMPIVSRWVMPMGILGVVTIPFGYDGLFWRQMGYGIEWMDWWRFGFRACRARSAASAPSARDRSLSPPWACF